MKELTIISQNTSDDILISGRELHEALEIKTPYKKWMIRMIDYGFAENVDFIVTDKFVQDVTSFSGERKQTDHHLKLDMAKEIAMIQRTDLGKQYRKYLLEVERRYKNQVPQISLEEQLALQVYRGGIDGIEAHKQLIEMKTAPLIETINEQQPKAEVYDKYISAEGDYTSTDLAKKLGFSSAQKFNKFLIDNKVIFKRYGKYIPYAYIPTDSYKYVSYIDSNLHVHETLHFTPKFIDYLKDKKII